MDSIYNWIVFLHVVGAFTFALAHGVSAGVALKLRHEREIPRVPALLDLSNTATQGLYIGLLVLLIGGITAAFMAGLWARGWIWTAIVLLVAMIGFMWVRASRYYGEVRRASGLAYYILGKGPAPLSRRIRRSWRGSLSPHARWNSRPSDRPPRDRLADGDEAVLAKRLLFGGQTQSQSSDQPDYVDRLRAPARRAFIRGRSH